MTFELGDVEESLINSEALTPCTESVSFSTPSVIKSFTIGIETIVFPRISITADPDKLPDISEEEIPASV